ncbi:MAG: S41 family peptidase, partial [Gemmatimonadota bacterium]
MVPGPATPPARGALGFYRHPTLHAGTIVFAAEGDLWRVPLEGGLAQRLTTHHSEETDPTISPGGATLAFTARYEGPPELYTMPVGGGLPTRRTYEADRSEATTWTPDGRLVYTTRAFSGLPGQLQLVALDLEYGRREPLPLMNASEGTFDGSGRTVFFVRPGFHNNVTKRYTGGTARKIWKYTEGAPEAVPLTDEYRGESHSAMWWNGRVYLVTDRDGTMNVWSMDEEGGDLRQHTRHAGWDVRSPELRDGRIVYQLAADLWLYDIAADRTRLVPIALASDLEQLRERWVDDPMEYLTSAHLHPEGESVVLTARGRVFVAPVGSGRLVQASRASGVRYRDVVFLPDGETLLGLSDATGELEFVAIPANGVGEEEALTRGGSVLRFTGRPSPDGAWIAYSDNDNHLWVLDRETGEQRRISQSREGIGDVAWSPEGRWLAYATPASNSFVRIMLYDTVERTTSAVTSDRVNSVAPRWDPAGEFLYFLSDRNLESAVRSPWGPRAPEPFIARPMEVYEVALRAGLRSAFRPADELHDPAPDEETDGDADARANGGGAREGDEAGVPAPTPVEIDLDGVARRIVRVPVPAG